MAAFTRRQYAQAYLHVRQIDALSRRKRSEASSQAIQTRCFFLCSMIEEVLGQMDTDYALTIVSEPEKTPRKPKPTPPLEKPE